LAEGKDGECNDGDEGTNDEKYKDAVGYLTVKKGKG
jgi:hypothetical protein